MNAGFGVALGRGLREASGESTTLPRYAQCGGSGGNCAQYSSCDNNQFNGYTCTTDDVRKPCLLLVLCSLHCAVLFRVELHLSAPCETGLNSCWQCDTVLIVAAYRHECMSTMGASSACSLSNCHWCCLSLPCQQRRLANVFH